MLQFTLEPGSWSEWPGHAFPRGHRSQELSSDAEGANEKWRGTRNAVAQPTSEGKSQEQSNALADPGSIRRNSTDPRGGERGPSARGPKQATSGLTLVSKQGAPSGKRSRMLHVCCTGALGTRCSLARKLTKRIPVVVWWLLFVVVKGIVSGGVGGKERFPAVRSDPHLNQNGPGRSGRQCHS